MLGAGLPVNGGGRSVTRAVASDTPGLYMMNGLPRCCSTHCVPCAVARGPLESVGPLLICTVLERKRERVRESEREREEGEGGKE